MESLSKAESQLLLEARRTTHAVRALARFFLIFISYQVATAVIFGIGFGIGEVGSTVWIAALVAVVGLIHALTIGFSELGKSDRSTAPASDPKNRYAHRLFDGTCDCTPSERAQSGTDFVDETEFCLGCSRVLSK